MKRLPARFLAPDDVAFDSHSVYLTAHRDAGLRIIASVALATLIALLLVDSLRLAMLSMGPAQDEWHQLSALSQAAWHGLLPCYGVLLVGSATLCAGCADSRNRWCTILAVMSLAISLASRVIVIASASFVSDNETQAALVATLTCVEELAVLGALLAIDVLILGMTQEQPGSSLRISSVSHAVLVICLGIMLLLWTVVTRLQGVSTDAIQREIILRLVLGALCFAWTVNLANKARQRSAEAEKRMEV